MSPTTMSKKKVLQDSMFYRNTKLLDYRIEYPEFSSATSSSYTQINLYYQQAALKLQTYVRTYLFPLAIEQYLISVKNNFPIRPGQFLLFYELPYNKDCYVSVFLDQYEYMGGAHGDTTRFSQTWNINTGKQISLLDLMTTKYYVEDVVGLVKQQIATRIRGGDVSFYENVQEDVRQMFQDKNFYIKPKGIVIYFQQYEIAPYASGIPEFLLPFDSTRSLPSCKNIQMIQKAI